MSLRNYWMVIESFECAKISVQELEIFKDKLLKA